MRKIGNGGSWTGISPKFCPKRKAEEETQKTSKRCRELLADNAAPEPQEEKPAETADLPSPPPDQTTEAIAESSVITARAETVANTFNYAVLTAEMGDFLKRKEQQLKNEYMNFTANCGQIFAEAQEKLAKDGHGTFVKWIEYMGFKTPTVYRMIDVYKFRLSHCEKDENGTQEIFDALPKLLQYDISAKSAPPELVEQVLSGDITTHKEYIDLKKELERTREECRQIDANSAAKDKEYKQQLDEASERVRTAEMQARTYKQNYLRMEKNFDEMSNENIKLEKQIKELESRPTEVVYEKDETEINRLQEENTRLEEQLKEAQDELMFSDPNTDGIKIFAVKLTLDEYETLTEIVGKCDNAVIRQAIENAQVIRI